MMYKCRSRGESYLWAQVFADKVVLQYLNWSPGKGIWFSIAYVDRDIACKRVCETNTQQMSLHWPVDDESMYPIVPSIISITISSIVQAAIACLPDHTQIVPESWGCQEKPTGYGGLCTCNVTPILDNNTAARYFKAAQKFCNPTLLWVVYHGQ